MSFYQIEIDDKAIIQQVQDILNTIVNRELKGMYGRKGDCDYIIKDAVKDIIYSRKDEIIEMVVERASKEIVKKGLPKLLERGLKE